MTSTDTSAEAFPDESYQDLYERAPCGFLSVTLDGTILRVNETLLEWIGFDRETVVGGPITALLSPGTRLFYETRFIPVLRLEGQAREIAMEMRRADGSSLHVLTNSTVTRIDESGSEIVRTAVFDSTERHHWERDLVSARQQAETSEARVRVLQDASIAFALSDSPEMVAQALVDSARDAFAATDAAVLLLKGPVELYVAAGVHPLLQYLRPDVLEFGSEALRLDDMFILSSVEEAFAYMPSVGEAMRLARVESLTVTPIQSENGLFGVLHCFYGRQREFDPAYGQLNHALARQASQVIARLRLQEQLARDALHDQLTGLANRTLLQERLDEAIAGAHRADEAVAVLFVDLDGFKAVNDHLGHVVGDAALKQVADRLRAEVRATDVVGRFGGDEFVIVCGDGGEEAALAVAERVRAAIALPLDGVPDQYRVTASVGIALWEPGGSSIEGDALFRTADEAMYRSKNSGKDCVTLVRL
jgi:diguanylate cyclase (GGDEF)-like protein/PAS domain S-box-containing protein